MKLHLYGKPFFFFKRCQTEIQNMTGYICKNNSHTEISGHGLHASSEMSVNQV